MDIKHFKEILDDEVVRKRLAKKLVHDCFRNTIIEDWHAEGRISQEEIKALMIQSVDLCYSLLTKLSDERGDAIVEGLKQHDELSHWNDPQLRIL